MNAAEATSIALKALADRVASVAASGNFRTTIEVCSLSAQQLLRKQFQDKGYRVNVGYNAITIDWSPRD